jgi:hypothetical protein
MADENEEYLMETRFSAEHIGLKLLRKKSLRNSSSKMLCGDRKAGGAA